jgi:hypothetical protein
VYPPGTTRPVWALGPRPCLGRSSRAGRQARKQGFNTEAQSAQRSRRSKGFLALRAATCWGSAKRTNPSLRSLRSLRYLCLCVESLLSCTQSGQHQCHITATQRASLATTRERSCLHREGQERHPPPRLLPTRHIDRHPRYEIRIRRRQKADYLRLIRRLRDPSQRHSGNLRRLVVRRALVPVR